MKISSHVEIKTIEHKGIQVHVEINYDEGTVALVEKMPSTTAKKWIFANRTVDYMDGWLNILEAMRVAIKECKRLLEADQVERSKDADKIAVRMAKVLNKKK